jgi:hypothetical protein
MKPFTTVTVLVLAILTIVHLYRLIVGLEIVVSGTAIPQWVSGIAALVTGILAVMVWRESRRR